MDKEDLILRELQEANRRLARIEEAVPVLSAFSSGSEAEMELRDQRRTRQARGRQYLTDKLKNPSNRHGAAGRRRS